MIHVLYNITTSGLLRLRLVSHRLQNLILRIVHSRLLLAASLDDRKLLLECYHPSAQYSEPYLYCDYLGTPGLNDHVPGQGFIFEQLQQGGGGVLAKLYSHFRPTRKDPQSSERKSHPAGDIPGTRTSDAAESIEKEQPDGPVTRMISLEAYENFSQLVFNTDLVQLGPRRGVFLDIMSVNEKRTLRIFRNWLARHAEANRKDGTGSTSDIKSDARLIWIDEARRTAGLRLRVKEQRKLRRDAPLLLHRDESQSASYIIELEGRPPPVHESAQLICRRIAYQYCAPSPRD